MLQFYNCCEHDIVIGNPFQLQHVNKWYRNATLFEAFEFKFANEEIQLVLEKEQVKDGWTISTRSHPCIVRINIHLYNCMVCAKNIRSHCMQWPMILVNGCVKVKGYISGRGNRA